MGFTESSRLQDMQEQVMPYRTMAGSLDIQSRIDEINTALLLADRSLPTSNDRFQFTFAYLAIARNQLVIVDSVYDSVTKIDSDETKAPQFSYKALGGSLISGYQAIKSHIEASEKVSECQDFKADDAWFNHLQTTASWQTWLPAGHISGRYVRGAVEGLRRNEATTLVDLDNLNKDSAVSNMFKIKITSGVAPTKKSIDTNKKTLTRAISGAAYNPKEPILVAEQALSLVTESSIAVNNIRLWMSVPRMFDASLAPANPLDESGKAKREFDPRKAGVAKSAPKTTVAAVPRQSASQVSAKPFDPTVTTRPQVVAPVVNKPSGKPFNVKDTTPVPKVSAKPFNPTDVTPVKPFNPSDTIHTNTEATKPVTNSSRPFSPDAVKMPETINTAPPKINLRAFDPSTILPDTDN